jgi:hypothetical protein
MPEEERQVADLAAHLDLDSGRCVEIFDLHTPKPRLGNLAVTDVVLVVPRHDHKVADARGSPLDSDASIAPTGGRPITP